MTLLHARTSARSLRLITLALTALVALCFALPASTAPSGEQGAQSSPTKKKTTTKSPTKKTATKGKRTKRTGQASTTRKVKLRDGAYLHGGLGVTTVTEESAGLELDGGTVAQVGAGYRFTPELALEAGLVGHFQETRVQNQDQAQEHTLMGANLNLKYIFPIAMPRVEGFAQAGLGYLSIDDVPTQQDISGTTLELGAGADYRLSKEAALGAKVGYTTLIDNDNNQDFSALSLLLTFSLQL